jgi:hypothetical protein
MAGIKLPFNVDGQPPDGITMSYLTTNGMARIRQGIDIYTHQNVEPLVTSGQTATQWDSVFIVIVGIIAIGIAEFAGREIGFLLGGFLGGLGGLVTPIIAAIISMAAYAAGFAGAVYASQYYLQNQKVNVSMPQHSMYYALVWLPLTLVTAVLTFFTNAVGLLIVCLFPIFILVAIAVSLYGIWLLKIAFDRVYGTDNNRGLLTAIVAVVGGGIARVIVGGVLGAIFRISFGSLF